jgi:hypothetical protein
MNLSSDAATGFAILVVVTALAGCVGVGPPAAPTTETSGATQTERSPTPDATERTTETTAGATVIAPSNDSVKARAIDAERARIASAQNASNVSGSVGGYDDPGAAVVGREDGAVRVRVSVPYSYSYDCGGNAGAADLSTEVVYRVTDESIRLVEVVEDVRLIC